MILSLSEELLKQDFIVTNYQLIPYKLRLSSPYDARLKAFDTNLKAFDSRLKASWKTSQSTINYRQGLLVTLIFNQSLSVTGECAPMSEIGTENLIQAQQFLENRLPALIGKPASTECLLDMETLPACRFALESALLSLIATQKKTSIAKMLNPEHARKVKVNAMLGALNDSLITAAKQAESQGFSCLKIKVGLNDIEYETEVLRNLLKQISPSTVIRLDANKSWTVEQTQGLLSRLEPYKSQIDSLEEPLITYNEKHYQNLQSKTSISLALDESFSLIKNLEQFPVRRLVLKPMAQGGIINSYYLAKQAQAYKIETVITSSIETGHGLWPISNLCAAINNQQFHGLATAPWLEKTLIEAPEIKHGIIIFP